MKFVYGLMRKEWKCALGVRFNNFVNIYSFRPKMKE